MATQSPFSFLGGVFERMATLPPPPQWLVSHLQPPPWLVHETQRRVVLFVNHVLMQESAATERLRRQQCRVARIQWRGLSMALLVTPAGLFDLAPEFAVPDLRLQATQTSPFDLAQTALRGDKPNVRIEGDVQLAADLQWLADNVRWDAEEDLARLIGDVPAHTLAAMAQRGAQALRQFVGARTAPAAPARSDYPVTEYEQKAL
jgi:ubiquinone biosynthesis protein UbiJ